MTKDETLQVISEELTYIYIIYPFLSDVCERDILKTRASCTF